jgi:RNA polymerase sigma-70 factor, ECF subfamily
MWEPDPKLVAGARRGDAQAFEQIVRGLLPDVFRLARHMVRDPHLAEDVAQDAFIRAYRGLKGFRGNSKFSTWMLRITRNAAVDSIRNRRRRQRLAEQMAPELVADASMRVAVESAVAGLPDELREAFILIEVFGLTYVEAAEVLGARPGTLKSRMYRARKLLIAGLTDQEDAGEV